MQTGTGLELILNAAEGALQIVVTEDERLLCVQEWHKADRATEILAPALAEICKTLGISPAGFRRIACVRGPGSFTGIRLVLTTAAALRRVGQARLAGLDYMQALATSANDTKLAPLTAQIENDWQALAAQVAAPGAKAADSFRNHTALIARQLGLHLPPGELLGARAIEPRQAARLPACRKRGPRTDRHRPGRQGLRSSGTCGVPEQGFDRRA